MTRTLLCGLLALALVGGTTGALAASPESWFQAENGVIKAYVGPTDKDITIPATIGGVPVTGIDRNAFSQGNFIKYHGWVSVPSTVEWMGELSAPELYSGGRVYVPAGVTTFGPLTPGMGAITLDYGASYSVHSASPAVAQVASQAIGSNFVDQAKLDSLIPVGGLYIENGIVLHYGGRSAHVTIPSQYQGVPVTAIAPGAFVGNAHLNTVTLPDTLVEIGQSAFSYCTRLHTVNLPQSLQVIGDYAFMSTVLEELPLPEGLLSIGTHAFSGSKLKALDLPTSVTHMGYGAVAYCRSIERVTLSPNLGILEGNFEGCTKLNSLVIPEGITELGILSLCSPSLLGVDVPASVVTISPSVFVTDDVDFQALDMWAHPVIYGHPGTAAETMAKDWGLHFLPLTNS